MENQNFITEMEREIFWSNADIYDLLFGKGTIMGVSVIPSYEEIEILSKKTGISKYDLIYSDKKQIFYNKINAYLCEQEDGLSEFSEKFDVSTTSILSWIRCQSLEWVLYLDKVAEFFNTTKWEFFGI